MERWMVKSVELLLRLSFLGKKNPAVIPYLPQKTRISLSEAGHLRRSKPERCGVPNSVLFNMLSALEEEKRANIHNLLVIKGGEVILECSAPGHEIGMSHLAHSMSKSVTGIAVGLLVDAGLIDIETKVYKFFPEYTPKDKNFKKISVKNLLCMQSGINFNEAGSVSECEWTRAFIESKVKFQPGTLFAYNSMNTYMLAHIVTRAYGSSMLSLLEERLFAPLGITNYFWERSPEGIEKGGWGLHLSAESFAKIGMMMMHGGVYEGKRILSEQWVRESLKTHSKAPEKAGGFNYGFQLWVSRKNDEFLFNGMLGQNVWMCPKNDIVVSMNAENNELFQKSPALSIVQKYLGSALSEKEDEHIHYSVLKEKEKTFFQSRRWIYPRPVMHGISYRLGLKNSTPFVKEWDRILGRFSFVDNNQGILPLFIRAMQNNYTGGIESVSLYRYYNTLFCSVREGGRDITFEVGLYNYATTVLDFDGEKYVTRVLGSAIKNEEGEQLYKIEMLFPEMPNTRRITLRKLKGGKLSFYMEEMPNHKIAEPFVEALYATNPRLSFIIGIIEKRLGDKFIENRLRKAFTPHLIGVNVESNDYHRQLYEMSDRNDERHRGDENVASLLIKFSDKQE